MPIEKNEKWTCDLCGNIVDLRSLLLHGWKTNYGWVRINVPDRTEEKDWIEKVVCKNCVAGIREAVHKSHAQPPRP